MDLAWLPGLWWCHFWALRAALGVLGQTLLRFPSTDDKSMRMTSEKSIFDWISYPRAYFLAVLLSVYTFLISLTIVILAFLTRSQKALDPIIKYVWPRPMLWLGGVKVDVRGLENVRLNGKGFLLLFNHSSMVDIPVLYGFFPRSFRFGAKIELFDVPVFGKAMKMCGVLPIDRGNRNKVMKVYEHAIERVNNGECFALAPEGTRQEAETLGKFKRGPFEFAVNAKMEIVPVVVVGALKVMPKHSLLLNAGRFRRTVILEILPAVDGAEFTNESLDEFQEKVRNMMAPKFVQLNEELAGF